MATNAEKRRQQKRKERERRIRKRSNIRKNLPDAIFRLDVLIDGEWRNGVKSFSSVGAAFRHRDDTERRRLAGETIVPGKVVDIRDGSVVLKIEGSTEKVAEPPKPEEPPLKGTLPESDKVVESEKVMPDTLADKPKAAKKGFLGLFKK